jgi:hypothetical protein
MHGAPPRRRHRKSRRLVGKDEDHDHDDNDVGVKTMDEDVVELRWRAGNPNKKMY